MKKFLYILFYVISVSAGPEIVDFKFQKPTLPTLHLEFTIVVKSDTPFHLEHSGDLRTWFAWAPNAKPVFGMYVKRVSFWGTLPKNVFFRVVEQ